MLQYRKVRLRFARPADKMPLTTGLRNTDMGSSCLFEQSLPQQRLPALQERVEQSRFMLEPDLLACAVLGLPVSGLDRLEVKYMFPLLP